MTLAGGLDLAIEHGAPIPTWFGIGGGADRLARPSSVEELRRCLDIDPRARVLGDGANLLVEDEGVGELVVALAGPVFGAIDWNAGAHADRPLVRAGAGVHLPRLITEAVRRGLGGLEGLGGVPATIGGAVVMNAGGRYGQIADVVERIHAVDRTGGVHAIRRDEIDFGYRRSGLQDLVVTGAELRLTPADPSGLRARLKQVMAEKKAAQPLADRSAGCVFRNPTLDRAIDGIGGRGDRVSAGLLIDRAGCKGMRSGAAQVSHAHANFIVARPDGEHGRARARDVIELIERVRNRVLDRFGVPLVTEVVIWRREP